MNVFDQSARFVAKSDPPGFLAWLVPGMDPVPEFLGWLDTRTLPFPGEPDRTGDTVAELLDPSGRWALAIEFQAEPDADILDRLLEYLARLRRELRHGPGRRHKYRVAAGLVQLTGPRPADLLEMTLAGASPVGLRMAVALRALRDENAAATLAEIDAGRLGRWILPWVPLMNGGGKPTIIEEWKRLAGLESGSRARANHGAIALIFAGLVRRRKVWEQGLEGWNMKESAIVNEWKAEGRAEGRAEGLAEGRREARRADLLRLLELKFPGQVPAEWPAAIEAQGDLKVLSRWLDAVAIATSPAEFRAASKIDGRNRG